MARPQVRDFLTEQRLQREAAERERQLDARIRQLRVSELPGPREIKPGELEALIADCRRAQEALDSRMDAINRMDAGTPFPQALLPGPVALDGVGKSGAAGHHHAGRRVYSRTALAGRRSSSPGDESTSGAHRNSRRSGEGASGRSSREWSQDEGVGGSGRPSSGREQREESIGQGSFAAGTSNQRGPESSVASWTGPPDEHNGPLPGSPGPRRPQGTPRQGLAEPIKGSRPWTPSATGPRPPASASGHRESPPTPPPSRPRSTSSALMTSGPKRSLAERQRRSSDAGRALLAVDGEVKEGKTVILHGKAPPRTPTRSGRRSRDGGTSQGGAEAAEGPPPSTPPHPTLKVDPLQDLGADKVMKRVPSAGRRAGISARP